MKLGEAGADSLPRSIPIMQHVRRDDGGVPADRLRAHGRRLVGRQQAAGQGRRAARRGARMVSDAERTGQFADLSDAHADFAPDGRTATVDLAMTGDFNTDRSQAVAGAAARRPRAGAAATGCPAREVAVTGDTAGSVDFTSTLRSHLPLVFGVRAGRDVPGAGARVPLGRGRGDRGRAEPAVGRRGLRPARAGLPARVRQRPARRRSRPASSSTGCRCSCS